MALPNNPFAKSTSAAGQGTVVLEYLPPSTQVLTTFEYQYPLKLIAPDAHYIPLATTTTSSSEHSTAQPTRPITTLFLLTYGGGLLAGDAINLTVTLGPSARLALLTQGSTKIFKTPSRALATRQNLDVRLRPRAALCYLPDPAQPFAESLFEQRQRVYVEEGGKGGLVLLDWVSEGRKARGERWGFWGWRGRNEVWEVPKGGAGRGRLLLRDSMILRDDEEGFGPALSLGSKADEMGVLGTLIVHGELFGGLREFLMREFQGLPRIGAKSWGSGGGGSAKVKSEALEEEAAKLRVEKERAQGLLWTAAQVRDGFVLVKFGAKELDDARMWLGDMLKREGTVEKEFGHQALLCLR